MEFNIGQMKYGIAGVEKKQLWSIIKKWLRENKFTVRTKTTMIKDFPETVVMVQLQTSYYDPVDYYVNVGCMVKALNNNPSPLYDRDCMSPVRIDDKGSVEACIDDLEFYIDSFSSIEKLREVTLKDRGLYNMTSPKLLKYLGIAESSN